MQYLPNTKFDEGYQFLMCSHDELIEKGWELENYEYFHDDFPGNVISEDMLDYEGQILTVKKESAIKNWYHIDDDDYSWTWPVATFMPVANILILAPDHICEKGMTPIDGWFICKTCGTNLKQIKG